MSYRVAISRTEDGSGEMQILSCENTDEPNGVEVIVPVKRGNDFEAKAKEFYQFWQPGTVLVNGQQPEYIGGRDVTKTIKMVPGMECDYLVMGNVAYPLKGQYGIGERNYYNRYGVIARVGIGDVNFTPSRESLHYTRKTEETIKRIKVEFGEALKTVVQDDVESAPDHVEALKRYIQWFDMLGGYYNNRMPPITYRGDKIPMQVTHPFLVYDTTATRYAVDESSGMHIKTLADMPIIYGFSGQKINGNQRERMRAWMRANSFVNGKILICDELPEVITENDWIPDAKIFSWEDVKKTRTADGRTPRPKAMFDVFLPDAIRIRSVAVDEFPAGVVPVLVTPKDMPDVRTTKKFLEDNSGHMLVRLQTYRWEKFKRDNPSAREYTVMVRAAYDAAVAALTESDKYNMGLDYRQKQILEKLDPENIHDPELVLAIHAAKGTTTTDTMKAYHLACEALGRHTYVPKFDTGSVQPLNGYPLILSASLYGINIQHTTIYINAVYDMNK